MPSVKWMPSLKTGLLRARHVVAAVAIILAILAIEFHVHGIRNTTVTYSLLLAILFFAVRWERLETITASVVAALGFLYYFQPPYRTFDVTDPESDIAVAAFLMTAIIMSQTALKARNQTAEALERKRETERLYELGQAMLASESLQTTAWIAVNQILPIFGASGAAFYLQPSVEIVRAGSSDTITDDALRGDTANVAISVMSIEGFGSLGVCGAT